MNWTVIAENLPLYAEGAKLTLFLAFASLAISFMLAVPLAFLRNSRVTAVRYTVLFYTLVFRGTPLLVQLFLVYFGLAQFELIRTSILWPWLSSPMVCVLLTFVLNTTAYTTEIFAGGLRHIPVGEIEAARAYGMSRRTQALRILIPAMLTRSLPLYGNEMIMMLHATSLASTVTLLETTGVARMITLTDYIQFEPYVTAAAIYLALTFVLVSGFQVVQRRWAGYLENRIG
ncbi:ABC transporter permease subunit [Shinella yambaruensis]|uniref:ABC transporter permease n=1 Tax=Shinella yambaruensis TaxID=415996 RepID=A0ABQ5ZLU2_9HYPH|nr:MULTISPECIES: ABC transporter permease subunit [Shinella]CAI0334438.1 lysine/arginine/ornithine ABC transporter/histidine ABC transporter, membrane subunit HisM [Rhizobiaceae bacterium]CAK7260619.1 lysine/arginine/ornithine ABC transporter/histidine ABC transporter, membrane subunit HisM [Shinella sp. WSC3-e]MCJ8027180.1 ABC transporter permease subunit [Shinella yambaruensis]MCU7981236.1 ABC transporter permease subunit [Shinella yambaruensis]MDC7258787.1 ABC transporter permease subunit [